MGERLGLSLALRLFELGLALELVLGLHQVVGRLGMRTGRLGDRLVLAMLGEGLEGGERGLEWLECR